jgi:hypothetical protein
MRRLGIMIVLFMSILTAYADETGYSDANTPTNSYSDANAEANANSDPNNPTNTAAPTSNNTANSEGEVYKSTDANGAPSFSDKPSPGAEKITVAPVQTFSTPNGNVQTTQPASPSNLPAVADTSYQELSIVSPQVDQYPAGSEPTGPQGATVWSNDGTLAVGLSLEPGLHTGDTLQLLVNGQVVQESTSSTTLTATGLDPNQYSISAQVIGPDKQVKITSAPLLVFIRHHTKSN